MSISNRDGKVAILLATYEGSRYIEEQVQSILNQSYSNFDLLIHDDQSSFDFKSQIRKISATNKRIFILPDSNKRFGSATGNFFHIIKNLNIEEYSYFLFADQDDIWLPNKVSECINFLKIGYSGYSSNLMAFTDVGDQWLINKSNRQTKFDYFFQGASAGCTYGINFNLMSLIKNKVDSFETDFYVQLSHDWIIYGIARSYSFSWYHDANYYIFYRQHENNFSGSRKGFSRVLSMLKKIFGFWYFENILKNIKFYKDSRESSMVIDFLSHPSYWVRIKRALSIIPYARRNRIEAFFLAPILIFYALCMRNN